MLLTIKSDTAIHQLQLEFNKQYPFLRLEFYGSKNAESSVAGKQLNPFVLLKSAGLKQEGELLVDDQMTVKQLERALQQGFGLMAQVSRRSGMLWLQTTITDNWTLQKQNEHGREISLTLNQYPGKTAGG